MLAFGEVSLNKLNCMSGWQTTKSLEARRAKFHAKPSYGGNIGLSQLRSHNSKTPKEAEGGEKRTIKRGRLPQWPSSFLPTPKSAGDSLEARVKGLPYTIFWNLIGLSDHCQEGKRITTELFFRTSSRGSDVPCLNLESRPSGYNGNYEGVKMPKQQDPFSNLIQAQGQSRFTIVRISIGQGQEMSHQSETSNLPAQFMQIAGVTERKWYGVEGGSLGNRKWLASWQVGRARATQSTGIQQGKVEATIQELREPMC
ncbi:hypothetical protein F5887DRAFT_916821 [Amanita rubescens]|nr:hypothetical protein F5887DRAFT_916821 [Amanita rubescens]